MSWTALIAEYLVIGFQGMVWLGLLLLALAHKPPAVLIDILKELPDNFGALLVFLALIAAYSLGAVLDHLWYLLTKPYLRRQTNRFWEGFYKSPGPSIGGLFYASEDRILGEEGQRDRLLRWRGRIRIVRALFFHIPLIWITVSLHYNALWTFILAAAFWVVVAFVFRAVLRQYLQMVARAARHLSP